MNDENSLKQAMMELSQLETIGYELQEKLDEHKKLILGQRAIVGYLLEAQKRQAIEAAKATEESNKVVEANHT